MEEFNLGPNGAMLYCLEYLEKNVDWLMEKLDGLTQKHLIFDFPGQVDNCGQVSCCNNTTRKGSRVISIYLSRRASPHACGRSGEKGF